MQRVRSVARINIGQINNESIRIEIEQFKRRT